MSKNATGPQVDQNRGDEDGRISQAQSDDTARYNQVDNLRLDLEGRIVGMHELVSTLMFEGIPLTEAQKKSYRNYVAQLEAQLEPLEAGEISDGYHTFNELYEFRLLYNAALFNFWGQGSPMYNVHKSWHHADAPTESIFGKGWFIVMATLPTGQISNHYAPEYWDLFQIPGRKVADTWDGHTTADVADRLRRFVQGNDLARKDSDDK